MSIVTIIIIIIILQLVSTTNQEEIKREIKEELEEEMEYESYKPSNYDDYYFDKDIESNNVKDNDNDNVFKTADGSLIKLNPDNVSYLDYANSFKNYYDEDYVKYINKKIKYLIQDLNFDYDNWNDNYIKGLSKLD